MNKDTIERVHESEYALIGLVLVDPESAIPSIRRRGLFNTEFASQNGKYIMAAAEWLFDHGVPVDTTSIVDILKSKQPRFFEDFRGEEFISAVLDIVNSGRADRKNIESYIDEVLDASLKRKVYRLLVDSSSGLQKSIDTKGFLSQLQYDLLDISKNNIDTKFASLGEMLDTHFGDIMNNLENPQDFIGLPTPSDNLNKMTGGIMPGEYWLVGGYPGKGKTSWLVDTGLINALREDKIVMFCSAEMPMYPTLLKILSAHFRIPLSTLRTGKIVERNKEYVKKQLEVLKNAVRERLPENNMHRVENFRFLECAGYSVPELEAAILSESAMIRRKPDLVIIDYIQILKSHDGESQSERIFWTSEALKTMAIRRNWALMVATQLNDDGSVFGGRAPHHNAHVHFDITDEDGKGTGTFLKVRKVRMAPARDLKVRFLPTYGIFEDADKEDNSD